MDQDRFDHLVRAAVDPRSRRGLARLLLGGALGLTALDRIPEAAARHHTITIIITIAFRNVSAPSAATTAAVAVAAVAAMAKPATAAPVAAVGDHRATTACKTGPRPTSIAAAGHVDGAPSASAAWWITTVPAGPAPTAAASPASRRSCAVRTSRARVAATKRFHQASRSAMRRRRWASRSTTAPSVRPARRPASPSTASSSTATSAVARRSEAAARRNVIVAAVRHAPRGRAATALHAVSVRTVRRGSSA